MRRRRLPKQLPQGPGSQAGDGRARHDGRGQACLAQVGAAGLKLGLQLGFLSKARAEGRPMGIICLPVAAQGLTEMACSAGHAATHREGVSCGVLAAGIAPQGHARRGCLLAAAQSRRKGACMDAAFCGAAAGHVQAEYWASHQRTRTCSSSNACEGGGKRLLCHI